MYISEGQGRLGIRAYSKRSISARIVPYSSSLNFQSTRRDQAVPGSCASASDTLCSVTDQRASMREDAIDPAPAEAQGYFATPPALQVIVLVSA